MSNQEEQSAILNEEQVKKYMSLISSYAFVCHSIERGVMMEYNKVVLHTIQMLNQRVQEND